MAEPRVLALGALFFAAVACSARDLPEAHTDFTKTVPSVTLPSEPGVSSSVAANPASAPSYPPESWASETPPPDWDWATSIYPALSTYSKPITFDHAKWSKDVVLWVDARYLWSASTSMCVALKFKADKESLYVDVPEKQTDRIGVPGVWFQTLVLNNEATYMGSSNGESAIGDFYVLGAALSSDKDGLIYRGIYSKLDLACADHPDTRPVCPQPCVRCEARFTAAPISPNVGIGIGTRGMVIGSNGGCAPCDNGDRAKVESLKPYFNQRVFMVSGFDGPAFFREPKDCRKDREERAAKASADAAVPSE